MIVLKNYVNHNALKATPINTHAFPDIKSVQKPQPTPKIYPIRFLHQKLTKTVDIKKKLLVKAYKHINKIGAVGPSTAESLYCIQHAKNIKTLKSFEFDPYLSDSSCIPELAMTYPRLKSVKEINLVIKRIDKQDLATKRKLMFRKFNRLVKARAELVYNGEIYTISPVFYLEDISKCYSLRSLTTFSLDLPFAPDKALTTFTKYRRTLLKLEELKMTKYRNYQVMNKYDEVKPSNAPVKLFNLKKFSFCLGNMPGWVSITEDVKLSLFYLDIVQKATKIEDLNLKFLKYPAILEFVAAFIELLPSLLSLKKLKLNFLKSGVGDVEILELCQSILKHVSLKQFTLKIFQYPNLSAEVVGFLVKCLAEHATIEVFDIYLRRVDMPERQLDDLVNTMKMRENIDCVRWKQSLHVYKRR